MRLRLPKPLIAAALAAGLVGLFTSDLPEAAVSRVKTWGAETLTSADLNAEFDNILNNGEDLGWPATKAKDLDGQELILDSDGDTSITADVDDRIDFSAGGQNIVRFKGNTANSVNFLDLSSQITGTPPEMRSRGEANIGLKFLDSNVNEVLILGSAASAVNELTIINAATGNAPIVRTTGEVDTGVQFQNSDGEETLVLASVATAVNEVTVTNAATGSAPSMAATGETDVSLNLSPKGAGFVQHSGVDIGALGTIQVFTSSGTWTKPAGLRMAVVEVVGGGGGGGSVTTTADSQGAGGGGGGYAKELILASAMGATETVTVGAAGAAGTAGGNGGTGGTTSLGTLIQATGGVGGGASNGTAAAGGAAGVGSLGDLNIGGSLGWHGFAAQVSAGGNGGDSFYGTGAQGALSDSQGAASTQGFGGGGAGANGVSGGTSRNGGAGKAGIVIVTEYY